MRTYEFDLVIQAVEDVDGAYVILPLDLRKTFGMGRMKVLAHFDGVPYRGSIVTMNGPHQANASKSSKSKGKEEKQYILGLTKAIRQQIGKQAGDSVHLSFISTQLEGAAWVYVSALLTKLVKKGRSVEDGYAAISWLFGYSRESLTEERLSSLSYAQWLDEAPCLNSASNAMKGKICGYDITEISDETMRRMRLLDKLIDDLAKGKSLDLNKKTKRTG